MKRHMRNSGLACAMMAMVAWVWLPLPSCAGWIRDPFTEDFLARLAAPILREAGIAPESVAFRVEDDASLNAYVPDRRHIVVHRGLLALAPARLEALRAVLAHEIAHLYHGDVVATTHAIEQSTEEALYGALAGMALMVAGAPDAGLWTVMASGTRAASNSASYSQHQEIQADHDALQWLHRAGYGSQGLTDMFTLFLQRQQLQFDAKHVPGWLLSHPLSEARLTAVERWKSNLLPTDRPSAASTQKAKKDERLQADLERIALQWQMHGWSHEQFSRALRPCDDGGDPERWMVGMAAAAKLTGLAYKTALGCAEAWLRREPSNGFAHASMGEVWMARGVWDRASTELRQALALRPDLWMIRIPLAYSLLETKPREALRELEAAPRESRDDVVWWFWVARAYQKTGQAGMASAALAEFFWRQENFLTSQHHAKRALELLPSGASERRQMQDILDHTSTIPSRASERRRQ
jgi:predicted Zn-dependent protease